MNQNQIERIQSHFVRLIEAQEKRVEAMKTQGDFIDYSELDTIRIGVVGGDGIGPYIAEAAQKILAFLLEDEVAANRVSFEWIEGLTIENRARQGVAIPADILEQLKNCHVILKGPMTTPREGDQWPNIESANVAMRRQLDLFANIRPVKVPEDDIDWIFFRENTEGSYLLGNEGINVNDEIAIDFKVTTSEGARRIIEMAFNYADRHDINHVTVVTKANVIKTTDGKFLSVAREVAKNYPDVEWDDWYIDIMTAKLVDPARRSDFKVFVLPNLYGDILTDEAAQFQGGVGTAGSANIGKRYAMFEAIHGSAPRMVDEGRAQYADPSSMIRASVMLLDHIGYQDKAKQLDMALDVCNQYEQKLKLTGRSNGATGQQLADYIMETVQRDDLEEVYESYQD